MDWGHVLSEELQREHHERLIERFKDQPHEKGVLVSNSRVPKTEPRHGKRLPRRLQTRRRRHSTAPERIRSLSFLEFFPVQQKYGLSVKETTSTDKNVVYYEVIKREMNRSRIDECRCLICLLWIEKARAEVSKSRCAIVVYYESQSYPFFLLFLEKKRFFHFFSLFLHVLVLLRWLSPLYTIPWDKICCPSWISRNIEWAEW